MVDGLATADIGAVTPERAVYTLFLTAKGRVVADARVLAVDGGLLIDTEAGAGPALRTHLEKFVPPLFARFRDVSDDWSVVGVYGEDATAVAATAAARLGGSASPAPDLPEESVVPIEGGFAIRTLVTGDDGWDLFGPADGRDELVAALLESGAAAGDPDSLEALRVAAGRPRFGRELTEDVIPLEAGLLDRAIDRDKGCYTGQEVIVRILHRGHVNRHLRRLEFSGPAAAPGTELFEPGRAKPRGVVTSAVENDAGALGLGYVRREVEPPAELRVGAPDGEPVLVTALEA
jgi:folate-binding protein YgfZ